MKKILSVLVVIISLNVYSQDFAPLGATWHYDYNNFATVGYVEINSISDTIVNGVECRKLEKTMEIYNYISEDYFTYNLGFEIISSDADNVYMYQNGVFYTLYDFSAEVNDTWEIPMTYDSEECDTTGVIRVIATGDTIINAEPLRYIIIEPTEESEWYLLGMIIEKIGAVEYYLFPEQTCMIDFFEGGSFRCYQDDIFDIEVGTKPCTFIITDVNSLEHSENLQTFPSPAHDIVHFQSPNNQNIYNIKIYNISGTMIYEHSPQQSEFQWNCQNQHSGIYFYHIIMDGKTNRGKMIIN